MNNKLLPTLLIIAGVITVSIPVIGHTYTYFQQRTLLMQLEEGLNQPFSEEYIKQADDIDEDTAIAKAGSFDNVVEGKDTGSSGESLESNEDMDKAQDNITAKVTKTENLPAKQNSGGKIAAPKASGTAVKAIAALEIPKLDLKVPVVEGVKPENLRIGVGHLTGTSDIGEVGNAVLAGHRNYTFARFFRHLDQMETGDTIKLTTNKGTYIYEVYKKLIIEPDDMSVLKKNNKDKVLTLITCHPVPVATHRLVIHARLLE